MGVETEQLLDADGVEISVVLLDVALEIFIPDLPVALAVGFGAFDVIFDVIDVFFVEAVRGVADGFVLSLLEYTII